MCIHIFVVISLREATEGLPESFPTGIIAPGFTVAVSPPISERLSNNSQLFLVGKYSTTLTHRNVVSRVEAQGCNITIDREF
jgi:hypothetical protein